MKDLQPLLEEALEFIIDLGGTYDLSEHSEEKREICNKIKAAIGRDDFEIDEEEGNDEADDEL